MELYWFCAHFTSPVCRFVVFLQAESGLFALCNPLYRLEGVQLRFGKWVNSGQMAAGFRSWQPSCSSEGPSSPSLWHPVSSSRLAGKGGEGPPGSVSISCLFFSASLPLLWATAIYSSKNSLFIQCCRLFTRVELTLGFFKCAIKMKSGHLYF